MASSKIEKFFKEYGFKLYDEPKIYTGHIAHAKMDYYENHQPVIFLRDDIEFIFVSPISGTKMYRLLDKDTKSVVTNGSDILSGFTQQQFIDSVKKYFKLK